MTALQDVGEHQVASLQTFFFPFPRKQKANPRVEPKTKERTTLKEPERTRARHWQIYKTRGKHQVLRGREENTSGGEE